MEHLFKTELSIDGQSRPYDVTFAEEAYVFTPLEGEGPTVRIRREEDEWHPVTRQEETLTQTCVDQLEQYLLRQH